MAGEAAGPSHPPRPHRGGGVGVGSLSPHERGLDGDRPGADRVEVGHEVRQETVCLVQVVAESAAHPQVVTALARDRAHPPPPPPAPRSPPLRTPPRSTSPYPCALPT